MKDRRYTPGFTVIEVVLFLAITGLMLAGLMVGIGGAIDRERYNDAVTSLHDFLQGQYNLIDNVNTNRPTSFVCSPDNIATEPNPSIAQPRGTSDCSIVGRLVSSENGRDIIAQPIYATEDINAIPEDIDDEADLLDAMGLMVADVDLMDNQQDYKVAWDTAVYVNGNETDNQFSLALIRLHTNSMIRSFVVPDNRTDIDSIIADAPTFSSAVFCVARDGLVSSPALGIKLRPSAANANSLQRTVGSEGEC